MSWNFDIVTALWTIIVVTLGQKAWYVLAAWLAKQPSTSKFGLALGGLVHNGS